MKYFGSPENNDKWIHKVIFPNLTSGTFVELGAANGISGSSCYSLEKLGWRGICVEPSLSFFPSLCVNRPLAICENVCITDRNGFVGFKENFYLSKVLYGNEDKVRLSLTLPSLLGKHGIQTINYLAMDVEGSEKYIMRAFPFEKYRIEAISMEGDQSKKLLMANGFVKTWNPFNRKSPWESYYIHKSLLTNSILRFVVGNFL